MKISSVFRVTDYKTKEVTRWEIEGYDQQGISRIRKDFPRFSKFVLEGFSIGENFVPLKIK